jgi:hypothetical protein
LHTGIGKSFSHSVSIGFVGDLFPDIRKIVLAIGVLDVTKEFGAFSYEMISTTEEVSRRSHRLGIDIGHGDHVPAKESGDFVGVDAIVFGLSAMDRFHIEGVTEDEGDLLFGTEVGQPVPGEHALDGDYEVFSIGLDRF